MGTPIRVILQESVDSLGRGGDLVRVRAGFARNYLYPRGLAVPATKGNLARIGELKAAADAAHEKERAEAQALAEKLAGTSVKLERAVGAENKMYGSVTSRDIGEAFEQKGIVLEKKNILLSDPIRSLGLHEVPVRLPAGVTAKLSVEVVKASS